MAEHVEESAAQDSQPSYPLSWIDRLIHWIDRLPGPAWLFYVLGVLATALLINAILWIDGSVPLGSVGSIPGIFPPFVFYFLALYHYLTRMGSRSLQAYRPLLEMGEAGIARVDHELAVLPRRLGLLAIPVGLASTIPYVQDPATFGALIPQSALPYVAAIAITGFFAAAFFCLFIRSIRQLRMVRRLHVQATNINLLKLEPTHAFSALTARTGIGLILVLILGYIYNPSTFGSNLNLVQYGGLALLAVIVFVVPIIGMRDLLEQEKERALNETSDLLQSASDDLHNKASRRAYDDFGGIESTISALIRERELLGGISTWPWDPRTIRSFASTLLLPIFLWLVTQLLGRFF
jgi:hypothetical protein